MALGRSGASRRCDSWSLRSLVLGVGDRFEPANHDAVLRFGYGDMGHRAAARRAMPVLHARRRPDDVAWADRTDGLALGLHPATAGADDEKLPERMGVPVAVRARLECDGRPAKPGVARALEGEDTVTEPVKFVAGPIAGCTPGPTT